jgi:hypothetical protein
MAFAASESVRCAAPVRLQLETGASAAVHVAAQLAPGDAQRADRRDLVAEPHHEAVHARRDRAAREARPHLEVGEALRPHLVQRQELGGRRVVQVVRPGEHVAARGLAATPPERRMHADRRAHAPRESHLGIQEEPLRRRLAEAASRRRPVAEGGAAQLHVAMHVHGPARQRDLGERALFLLVPAVVVDARVQVRPHEQEMVAVVGARMRPRGQGHVPALPRQRGEEAVPDMVEIEVPQVRPHEHVVRAPRAVPVRRGGDRRRRREHARVLQARHLLPEVVALLRGHGVRARIRRDLRLRCRVVRQLHAGAAGEAGELDRVARAEPARAQEAGVRLVAGMVTIPVGGLSRHARVGGEAVHEPRGVLQARALRAPRARRELQLAPARRGGDRHGLEVERPREARGAERAGPDAALHLYRLHGVHEVGDVREVEDLVLRIVERHAVHGDGQARLVHAPEADGTVAGEGPRIRRGGDARGTEQRERRVLPDIGALDHLPRDGGPRRGGGTPRARGADHHALERVARGRRGAGGVLRPQPVGGEQGSGDECCDGGAEHADASW